MKQFRDIGSLSFLSFAGIVTSLCYTIAVAIVFGVSRDVEIFFAASQVFMVFAALAQAGQLTEAFIPIFQKIKVEQSVEQAHRAAGVMFVWLLVFATIVATLVFIFSKAIVSVQVSGFSASDQLRVAELLLVFCPLVVVQVGLAFLKGVAQAEKIFLWPEWAGIAGSLISLAAVVFLYDMGAMAPVIGLVSNVVLQILI